MRTIIIVTFGVLMLAGTSNAQSAGAGIQDKGRDSLATLNGAMASGMVANQASRTVETEKVKLQPAILDPGTDSMPGDRGAKEGGLIHLPPVNLR